MTGVAAALLLFTIAMAVSALWTLWRTRSTLLTIAVVVAWVVLAYVVGLVK